VKHKIRIQNLGGAVAVVLHRPHPTVQALERQLRAIGLLVTEAWPVLGPEALGADFVFFDVDMGHDEQFPWLPGQSPMPMIALIGSEAPGRIEWSLRAGAHAQLLKPVGDGGVYSTLLIARNAFDATRAHAAEIQDLRARLDERRTVVRAITLLMTHGARDDDAAYGQLRQMAMAWRISFEEAAARIVARVTTEHDTGQGSDDRRDRG
jgi:response regulator NasT